MKQAMINFFKKGKKSLLKNDGVASYFEFLISFIIIAVVFFTIVQIYFLISAQILVINTTKSTLRYIETYGTIRSNLDDNVRDSLSKIDKIDPSSINIQVSDPEDIASMQPATPGLKYQLRKPIKIKITANYDLFLLRSDLVKQLTSVSLSSTYTGASQRFFKDLPTYEIITE